MRRIMIVTGVVLLSLPVGTSLAGEGQKCYGSEPTLVGTNGDDVLEGTPERDVIAGLKGDDVIKGFQRRDKLCGGRGADLLFSGAGRDFAHGGVGRDKVRGLAGDDSVDGGPGRDRVRGCSDDDWLNGGETNKYLGHNQGDGVRDRLNGQTGYDSCYSYAKDVTKNCEGYVIE